jgi:hypothetical protein
MLFLEHMVLLYYKRPIQQQRRNLEYGLIAFTTKKKSLKKETTI